MMSNASGSGMKFKKTEKKKRKTVRKSFPSHNFLDIPEAYSNSDDSPFHLDPDLARELRPRLAVLLDLCRKHGIPRMGEWATIDEVAGVLREGYGMEEDEAF